VLSIVIPARNQAAVTATCLAALLASPPDVPFELLIVDDASAPPLTEALSAFSGRFTTLAFLRNEINQGFAASCNLGAQAAKGRYLLFLNNDTEVRPGWWPPLMSILDNEPEVGIVVPKLIFPSSTAAWSGKTSPQCRPSRTTSIIGCLPTLLASKKAEITQP